MVSVIASKRFWLVCAFCLMVWEALSASNAPWVQAFLTRWNAEAARTLWLFPPLKDGVKSILGHPYAKVRLTYWVSGDKTLWVLEEIGKEQPITTGIVIQAGKVKAVDILKYRESRGGEVKLPAFRQQFVGSGLTSHRLTRQIDGISGATLSVNAVKNLVRMALYLDQYIHRQVNQ